MLGPHCIGIPASLPEFMERSGCGIVKYLDPDKPVLLAPITIGRIHTLSEEKDLGNPVALALRHADVVSVRAEQTGIGIWEGINEPPIWNGGDYISRLVVYENERVRILNERGLGAVVLNLSVGWPGELEDGRIDWGPFKGLLEELPDENYLGLHEYWLPTGPLDPASRHHRAGRLARCPYNIPIIVGECGVDIGGGQDDGWRAQGLSVEQYAYQLAQYRDMLTTDPRVKGATIFTYGNKGDWSAFDIEPDWKRFIKVCQPVESAPEVADPIRVRQNGEIITLKLEEYLRGVVPAEMLAQWDMEALRAQAVAARSFAMWKIEHPYQDFDIYADARDQVYNPHTIHERSDQAIADTAGIYLLRDGEVYMSEYVVKCGRTDCLYCDGKNGYDDKVWLDRMCQYGAQDLAERGSLYRDILYHYYGLTTQFSDGGGSVPTSEITIDKYPVPANGGVLGLHWTPKQYHDVADLRPFMDRAKEARVGSIMLLDDGGGSVLQPSQFYGGRTVVDELQERQFQIAVRMFAGPHAKFDGRMEDTCGRLVEAGVLYQFWQNEPECEKWPTDNGNPPADWVEIVFRNWVEGAYKMKALGAYPGTPALTTFHTPDPQGNIVNPFLAYMSEQERHDLFITWYAWVNRHIYPINHPLDYPYDPVHQTGLHITQSGYDAAIAEVSQAYRDRTGEYWVWETWEHGPAWINKLRDEGKRPGSTLLDDDVCWLSYTGTVDQMREAGIDRHAIILGTEVGTCIGDKGADGRWPRKTAAGQIRTNMAMLAMAEEDPHIQTLFFWLAGCRKLAGTESNFERQSFWTHVWDEVFDINGEVPFVQHLVDNYVPGAIIPIVPPPIEPPEPSEEPMLDWQIPDWNEAEFVRSVEADCEPGDVVWHLIRTELAPDNMANTVWIHVLDEHRQPTTARVMAQTYDNKPEELPVKVSEPYNRPYWPDDCIAVWIGEDTSDMVRNMHGNYWNIPGVNARHVGYILTFQRWIVPETEEPPTPEPEETLEEFLRRKTWDTVGVDYNPDAAFTKYAEAHGLGKPETNEFDLRYDGVTYRVQAFIGGIVYCVVGEWGNIQHIGWS